MSEKPIFRLRRINGLQFDVQVTHMVVSNEWMYVVLRTKVVVIIDMNGQEEQKGEFRNCQSALTYLLNLFHNATIFRIPH